MKNFIKSGTVLDYTNDTGDDILSGDVVVVGELVGVAVTNIADTETGSVNVQGAFEVASSGFNGDQGAGVYWDKVEKEVVDTPNSNTIFMGNLLVAAVDTSDTVQVVLDSIQAGLVVSDVAAVVAPNAIAALDDVAATFADEAAARTAVNALKDDVQTDLTALKTSINAIITSLQGAGLMDT